MISCPASHEKAMNSKNLLIWNSNWTPPKLQLFSMLAAATMLGAGFCAQAETTAETEDSDDELTTVVVSASRFETEDTSVVVVRPDSEPYHLNVVDLFRSIPGLAVSTTGNPAALSQIRIRGAEANHTLVLIDGVNANDPASEFNFGAMTPLSLERIEILKGPSSSTWGSDALGGVIYLDTRPTSSQTVVDFNLGSQDHRGVSADWSLRDEAQFARVSVLDRRNSGFNANRIGDESDGLEQRSLNLHAGLARSGFDSSAAIRWLDSLSDYDPYLGDGPLQVDTQRTTFMARTSYVESKAWTPRVQVSKSRTYVGNLSQGSRTNHSVGSRRTISWDNRIDLGDQGLMHAVLENIDEQYRQRSPASIFGDPNQDQAVDRWGLAFEYSTSIENLALRTSVRKDWNSKFSDSITWNARVGVPISDMYLFAAVGSGSKNPSFTELFGYFPGSFIGNSQLEPETSLQWQVGSQFNLQDVSIEATWFAASLEKEINGFVYSPEAGAFTANNISGESTRRGVEVSLESQWRILNLRVGYAFIDSEAEGTQEIRRPRHSGSAKAMVHDFFRWNVTVGVVHHGSQDDTDFSAFPSRQVELEPISLVTIQGEREISNFLKVSLIVENALDVEYEEVLNYSGPGLSIRGGLRLTL